jgi:hypothetical protein
MAGDIERVKVPGIICTVHWARISPTMVSACAHHLHQVSTVFEDDGSGEINLLDHPLVDTTLIKLHLQSGMQEETEPQKFKIDFFSRPHGAVSRKM